jgi:hypothetical protein
MTVPAIQLSAFIKEQSIHEIDYLKIDVEGAEYASLFGDYAPWDTPIHCLVAEIDRLPRCGEPFQQLISLLRCRFKKVHENTSSDYPLFVCY